VLGKGTHDLEGYTLEGKGYFGPGELPVFDRGFFNMPHGNEYEWSFESFKEKAKAAGGEISDELMQEFKQEMANHLSRDTTDHLSMMDQDADYI
ncbi:MAG: hypothetical protein J4N84_16050, partial [Chloroflexi bacterium]|nr:hypothetical protein [Chloroflexota bacterium]